MGELILMQLKLQDLMVLTTNKSVTLGVLKTIIDPPPSTSRLLVLINLEHQVFISIIINPFIQPNRTEYLIPAQGLNSLL